MRPILPKEVWDELDRMYDIIIPYMFYTEGKGWAMRPDAPPELSEANRKIDEFREKVKRSAM